VSPPRELHYGESLTRTTYTGSTVSQTKFSLAWQPKADTRYLIGWRTLLDANASATVTARLYDVVAAFGYPTMGRTSSSTERVPIGGIHLLSFGTAPAAQEHAVQFATANASNTVGCQQAVLWVLELTALDEAIGGTDETATALATYQDARELAFTPATAGDYLILAAGQGNSSTAGLADARMFDGATAYGEHIKFTCVNSGSYMPWMTMVKKSLTTGPKSFKAQVRSNDGVVTARLRRACMAAIRLDSGFGRVRYAEQRTRQSTTLASMQDASPLSSDWLNTPALVLAMGVQDMATTGYCSAHLYGAGAAIGVDAKRQLGTQNTNSFFEFRRYQPLTRAQAWKLQWQSDDGVAAAGLSEAAVAVLAPAGGQLRIGGVVPDAIKRGSSHVDRVYVGPTQVWGF
jgi:hypothetical protein